ncbi:MAG: DMT family transporter [Pseudomonadota bacterium]
MGPVLLYGPLVVTVTMWAFQAPALHALGERWDPATLNLARYLLAMMAFSVIVTFAPSGRAEREAGSAIAALPWTHGLLIGVLFGGFGLLFATGSVVGNPVVSATTAAVMPITASLVNWIVTGQRPERTLLMALVLVVPGAVLAMPRADGVGGDLPVLGLVLVLLAQVCWSLYSLTLPRLMPEASTIRRTRVSIHWALLSHLVVFLLVWIIGAGRADLSFPVFDGSVTLAAALGPMVLGLALWNLSVARLGLPVCALFLNLVPVVGTLIAWAFGTVPSLLQILGVTLVILGMGFAQYRRKSAEGRSPLPRG